MEEYQCEQTTPFLDYVKNVIDSDFQMEFKTEMGEGKGLIITAVESEINATYVNGGLIETANMLAAVFNTISKPMENDGDIGSERKQKIVCEFLNQIDEDWFDKFELFFIMFREAMKQEKKKDKKKKKKK